MLLSTNLKVYCGMDVNILVNISGLRSSVQFNEPPDLPGYQDNEGSDCQSQGNRPGTYPPCGK